MSTKPSDYFDEQDLHTLRHLLASGHFEPIRKALEKRSRELDRNMDPPRMVTEGDFSSDIRGVACEKRGVRFLLILVDKILTGRTT